MGKKETPSNEGMENQEIPKTTNDKPDELPFSEENKVIMDENPIQGDNVELKDSLPKSALTNLGLPTGSTGIYQVPLAMSEEEKILALWSMVKKLTMIRELLQPLVVIKGDVIKHTGSILPDFESQYVKQSLLSLIECTGWLKLLMDSYPEKEVINPNSNIVFSEATTEILDSLPNASQAEAAYSFGLLIMESINTLSTLDTSNKGREAAIFRTNLFSDLYRVYFLLEFEKARADEYQYFVDSISFKEEDKSEE